MKIPFCLLIGLLPLFASSQIMVVDKPTEIVKVKSGQYDSKIEMIVKKEDTSYSFLYRDHRYPDLVEYKSILLNRDELKELGKALLTCESAKNGDRVATPKYVISKDKTMGFILYSIFYDNGECELTPKQVEKIISAIDKI